MLGWAADEGWNPGLGDAEAFHAADPEGFLLGWLDGEPVAAISLVRYGETFAFLGLYIVVPEHRGRGFGRAMWDAALARAGAATVGLDGVPAQQPFYARSGFALVRRNVRYGGRAPATSRPAELVDAADVPREALSAYDRTVFPGDRAPFLERWLPPEGGTALVAAGDRIGGYGCIRPCRSGWKIGPLFADDADTAERLFAGLAAAAGGDEVYLDVPETNAAAVALAERAGLSPVFETARMYLGADPGEPVERIVGVTTFELG